MTLLIHDLQEEQFTALNISIKDLYIVAANGKFAPCQGCFRCWVKTPGYCYIKDELTHIGAVIGACKKVIIISQNCYGGYSKGVKNVLDRSISTSLPFITYRGKMLHHRLRYNNARDLTVGLYGDFTELEKATARKLVDANRVNVGYRTAEVFFAGSPEELEGVF